MNIQIDSVAKSRLSTIDFNKLDFGRIFTDHMLECDYENGAWKAPVIKAYQPILFDPSVKVFHYGQAIFEGLKAYKDSNNDVFLFRPDQNQMRINKSAHRLDMPDFPANYFHEGLRALVNLDRDWIQKGEGNSLYIRPFMIATENCISAATSKMYKFMIICSPVQAYYEGEIKVEFADTFSRAASGGVGYAKAAGNYASSLYPTRLAGQKGYQQIVWTDADTHENLEEAGTMNIFFRINDALVTAPISDRILDGITRKSIIQLAKDEGINVEVRKVSRTEIVQSAENGSLKEIFGTGTAAVISVINGFCNKNYEYNLPAVENSYAKLLKNRLTGIQQNKLEDKFGWRVKVD
jgi:branched-chain amino acid aminotransferase